MRNIFILLLLVSTGFVAARAQSRSQLRRMANQVATAYSLGELRGLDTKHLRRGSVRLTIENTNIDPEFEHYRFRSFSALGRWIRKQERDGFPLKVTWPLVGCRNGTCVFFRDGGILHNQNYLTRVRYGYRNKRLYVRGIQLLVG